MEGFEESKRKTEHPFKGQSVPVVLEINMLENKLKEKKREVGAAQREIKALKATVAAKDRALEKLRNEVNKMDERLRAAEKLLERKNLEINKLVSEKKDALAAQFAAEGTLRRVYADQNHSESVPIESFIAPLEADIKIYKNEIASLHEDKKALERLNKSKELALLEADKILKMALERALIVEEVQNQNTDLRHQIEICLEENKILGKANRQKVVEVDKLSQTIRELEEAVLAGGSAANTIRDCQRQISELNEEKRVLKRELSRARVAANRVATVVSSEWKDDTNKVIPVKKWMEERKLLQAEMQRLKDKLTVSERTTKAESRLKEKLQLRLKTLEDCLKNDSLDTYKPNKVLERNRSSSQQRVSRTSPLKRTNSFRTHASGKVQKENRQKNPVVNKLSGDDDVALKGIEAMQSENKADEVNGKKMCDDQDMVSGLLYDRLQKEVINLRNLRDARERLLSIKDEEIKILSKKVDALTKFIEDESRKIKRELTVRENKLAVSKSNENQKNRKLSHQLVGRVVV